MANVRAAALTNFDQVARYLGLEPEPLLRSAGLDSSVAAQPDRPLPVETVATLLEKAARLSDCNYVGLLIAESRSLSSMGPLSQLLMHQARVGDVVLAMVRYQHLLGEAIQFSLDDLGDAEMVRIELAEVPLARQGYELIAAYFCRCIAHVLGRPWSPESVHFTHSAPKEMTVYRRVFLCPVYFDSEFNGIVFACDALQEPNPASDEKLAAKAECMLALLMRELEPPSESEQTKRSLRLLLPEHRGSIEEVARNRCMSPRTLQRKLDREGQSFGSLLNEVRRELAERYLAASHPVGVVASLTGYERASSFTRWFAAEYGMPPAEWRKRLHAA